jgi:hypothetical protein
MNMNKGVDLDLKPLPCSECKISFLGLSDTTKSTQAYSTKTIFHKGEDIWT